MLTEFAGDAPTDPDEILRETAAERGGIVRLRLQPMILDKDGQYRGWRQVRWTLECDSIAEALATKDALRAFFTALTHLGPRTLMKVLKAALAAAAKGAA